MCLVVGTKLLNTALTNQHHEIGKCGIFDKEANRQDTPLMVGPVYTAIRVNRLCLTLPSENLSS